jgi:hypothetical protein
MHPIFWLYGTTSVRGAIRHGARIASKKASILLCELDGSLLVELPICRAVLEAVKA